MDKHFYIRLFIFVIFLLSFIIGIIKLILTCVKKSKYKNNIWKQENGQY